MTFPKKSNTVYTFLLLLIISISTGCTFYKTIEVENTKQQIKYQYDIGKQFIIHDSNEQIDYLLNEVSIESDYLSGTLALTTGKKHSPHKKSFTKKSVDVQEPLSVIHLYTSIARFDEGETSRDRFQPGPFILPFNSIRTIEIHEKDKSASSFGTTAITVGTVVVSIGIYLAIACNCPQVVSYSGDSIQYHGSLFPGSVLKSLERDDYVILHDPLLSEEGKIKLRISNEDPEHQYIDQLKALEVEHDGYANLGMNNHGELVAYNKSKVPFEAINGQSKDISNLLKNQDEQNYAFDNFNAFEELNEVQLKFEKSDFLENPTLILNAQQTEWLDTVANVIFYQAGKYQNKWVENKDNSSPDKWKKNNQKRGLSLNVYLKINDAWEYVGTHHDVGTNIKRDLLMELNLKEVKSQYVEIKLESAFKLWEIDYVGLTNEWKTNLNIKPLKLTLAETHKGDNALEEISTADDSYLVQKEIGNYIELHFEAPAQNAFSSIVLNGVGYYHKIFENEHKMNLTFFVKLKKKLGLQDVSRALYQYQLIQPTSPKNENSTIVSHRSN